MDILEGPEGSNFGLLQLLLALKMDPGFSTKVQGPRSKDCVISFEHKMARFDPYLSGGTTTTRANSHAM